VKIPADGWDRDERDAVEALRTELDAVQARHAEDPSLGLLRAARADALPEPLQENVGDHLARSAWSRALAQGLDDADVALNPSEESRLLARIQRDAKRSIEPRAGRSWRWNIALAGAAALFLVAGSVVIFRNILIQQPAPQQRQPEATVAVAPPPPAPVFRLALEKPDVKLSPSALTWRGSGGENRYLADLKPAFDAFRSGDYATADREFSTLSARYPSAVEVSFYQGVARLFLNDVPGAITSLTAAERLADNSFGWDVGWYRAVAEERAGNVAAARDRLSRLCRLPDVRAPGACDALKRIPQN
jgi:hypothetical protein